MIQFCIIMHDTVLKYDAWHSIEIWCIVGFYIIMHETALHLMHGVVLHYYPWYSFASLCMTVLKYDAWYSFASVCIIQFCILLHGVVFHHDAWCSLSVFYEAKPPSPLSTHKDCTLPHLQTVSINSAFNLCSFLPNFRYGIDFIRNFGLNISFLLQQHNFPPKI